MAGIIDIAGLAAYLRLPFGSLDMDTAADLYVDLANGEVSDIVGEQAMYPTRVKAITLEVAARGFRKSDGYTSMTTSFDDSSKTWRRESNGSAADPGGVYVTDQERRRLLGSAGRRVGSIRLRLPE